MLNRGRITILLVLLFTLGFPFLMLSYYLKEKTVEYDHKETTLQDLEKLCTSSEVVTNHNVRWSCKYLEEAKQSYLYLPDQLELENLEKLKFIKSPKPCDGIDFLVLVNSSPYNKVKRQTIRETWKPVLERIGKVAVFFVVGLSMDDSVSKDNFKEAYQNGDIILLELFDEYKRITIKHIMMYKWMQQNCQSVKSIMKCDDDTMVDPFQYDYVYKELMQNQTMNLYGLLFKRGNVLRYMWKWEVPSTFYPLPSYPDYLPGASVIQSRTATLKLLEVLPFLPVFGIDDVLIGGFSAALAGVTPVQHNSVHGKSPVKAGNWSNPVFSWLVGSEEEIRSEWKELQKHYSYKFTLAKQ